MDEVILGFDLRDCSTERAAARWPSKHRLAFLIKTDVVAPRSVDRAVWPSLEKSGGDESVRLTSVPGLLPLHHKLSDLEAVHRLNSTETCIIGITLLVQFGHENAAIDTMQKSGRIVPDQLEIGWRLLGYDVADEGLVSGLMNCGYDEETVGGIREHWTPYLNAGHLFDMKTVAFEFAEFSNSRVHEHAPFFVYGIYEVHPK